MTHDPTSDPLDDLYRRLRRIGETTVDVAERVIYAVVKES